ncbi:hypothetical protein Tco_1210882 [Tanacetum coccineum]
MIAITISWFLVCEVGEAFKDMIEHETHFIPNFIDEGLSALAMGTKGGFNVIGQILKLSNLFNDLFTGHEGFRMGTKSTISPIEVGWWKEGPQGCSSKGEVKLMECDKARVVVIVVGMWLFSWSVNDSLDEMSMMLVRATFLGGFLVEEEALEAIFGGELRRQQSTAHVTPPPLAYTPPLPCLATMEPLDALLMGDEVISTTLARENTEFIKSSVDDLVPIPRESEVTSVCNDLECSVPVDSPPLLCIDVLGYKT